MEWLQRQAPWVHDAVSAVLTTVAVALGGLLVKAAHELWVLRVWRLRHQAETDISMRDFSTLQTQVRHLSGRFGKVESAQAEAAARASEDRRTIAEALVRIEGRFDSLDGSMDARFEALTKRIDGVVDSRLKK